MSASGKQCRFSSKGALLGKAGPVKRFRCTGERTVQCAEFFWGGEIHLVERESMQGVSIGNGKQQKVQ